MSKQLSKTDIATDKRLSKSIDGLQDQLHSEMMTLAKLRWHWTANEDNPDRVTQKVYGKQVGQSDRTISRWARAYQKVLDNPQLGISEAFQLQKMHSDVQPVGAAVAAATGAAVGQVAHSATHSPRNDNERELRSLVAQTHDLAKSKAAMNGTSIEEEAPAAAKWIVGLSESEKKQKLRNQMDPDRTFINASSSLLRALRHLREAETTIAQGTLYDEQYDVLAHKARKVKQAAASVNMLFTKDEGSDFDWDAAFAEMKKDGGE